MFVSSVVLFANSFYQSLRISTHVPYIRYTDTGLSGMIYYLIVFINVFCSICKAPTFKKRFWKACLRIIAYILDFLFKALAELIGREWA